MTSIQLISNTPKESKPNFNSNYKLYDSKFKIVGL